MNSEIGIKQNKYLKDMIRGREWNEDYGTDSGEDQRKILCPGN